MAIKSAIEWTDATVNFWWGCTKVGPGCDHCYAETWDKRTGGAHWGTGAPRRWIKGAAATLARLNRQGGKRVFIQSMSDLFDNEVPAEWFYEAWTEILCAYECRIQIVTKRISMVEKRLDAMGAKVWPRHAGLMITVVNQAEADRDIPRLLALKAKLGIPWVGLSMEPLLGPVDLTPWLHDGTCTEWPGSCICGERGPRLDWVIVGGESGPGARPMHPDWARQIRDQCQAADVPFFFKQWGEFRPPQTIDEKVAFRDGNGIGGSLMQDGTFGNPLGNGVVKVGKKAAGRLLDGREWNEFPGALV